MQQLAVCWKVSLARMTLAPRAPSSFLDSIMVVLRITCSSGCIPVFFFKTCSFCNSEQREESAFALTLNSVRNLLHFPLEKSLNWIQDDRMSKGRFLNQKLGKRTDRKSQLLKARLKTQRPLKAWNRPGKPVDPKGPSR
jgi:hypothetical protein